LADSWYAVKLRFVILLETTGGEDVNESLYLLRSDGFENAFLRALEIGRSAETEYLGGTGERVRWRLKDVVTLDEVRAADLDGAEVYSQFASLGEGEHYDFDHKFQPELSKPRQTGI
jgi:hypothetical protein